MSRRTLPLRAQAFLTLVGLLVVAVAAGSVLVILLLRSEMEGQYEQRALAVARAVAADPAILVAVRADDTPAVQARAEAVRQRTGALFVVVTDERGVRLSHPNPGLLGQRVSTDPSRVLAGAEVTGLERGTLGLSARGKVPLRSSDGTVVGEVSVGIAAGEVSRRTAELVGDALVFTGCTLLAGLVAAAGFAARLKRQTLGLEPWEMAELLREQEAVLHGVADGVLAVDAAGLVTVCTAEAARLLGTAPVVGTPLDDARLAPRIRDVLTGRRPVHGEVAVLGDKAVLLTGRPVVRDGRDLGHVLTLRERSGLDDLSSELEALRAFSDALRAQSHEYTNRLHTLAGMLQIGHVDDARDYLRELSADPLSVDTENILWVRDPYLRGLLVAKRATASEHGVDLRLVPGSRVGGRLTAPLDAVTVLGNLIDNGVRAAASGARRPAAVDVSLLSDGVDLEMAVADSGDGVPAGLAGQVFDDGVTTDSDTSRPHGTGLALVRQVARSHGGDVALADAGGGEHGALFVARLPGLVTPSGEAAGVRGASAVPGAADGCDGPVAVAASGTADR
jgi:two-component system CitB family sensor kinase